MCEQQQQQQQQRHQLCVTLPPRSVVWCTRGPGDPVDGGLARQPRGLELGRHPALSGRRGEKRESKNTTAAKQFSALVVHSGIIPRPLVVFTTWPRTDIMVRCPHYSSTCDFFW